MKEGLLFAVELLAMLLLLLKVIKPSKNEDNADLGVFNYIEERPQAPAIKREGRPRA